MKPRGIIFDLDDTIIQFDSIADPTWRDICESHSVNNTIYDALSLYNAITQTRKWYWSDKDRHRQGRMDLDKTRRTIVEISANKIGIRDQRLIETIADSYSEEREKRIQFFPGAEETLSYLFQQGISLSLITNGDAKKQRDKVNRFGLERFFRTILIENEIGYGKPDEKVYLKTIREMELEPPDIWSVGDNLEWDVAAPQRLGIYGIWNDYLNKGLPPTTNIHPDRIINSISELTKGNAAESLKANR
jgi:putative hydrolase of the HAD superfamily